MEDKGGTVMLAEKTGKRIVFYTDDGDAVAERDSYHAPWHIRFPWRKNVMVLKARMDDAADFIKNEVGRRGDYKLAKAVGGSVKISEYYKKVKVKVNYRNLAVSHSPKWLGKTHSQSYDRRLAAFLLEKGMSVTKVHMEIGLSFKILNSIANQMERHRDDDKPVHASDIDYLAYRGGRRWQNKRDVTKQIRKENE